MNRNTRTAELGWIRRAKSSVREARLLLMRPAAGSLDESAPHIQAAVSCLQDLNQTLRTREARASRGELGAELAELRKEVSHTTVLLERAAAFYFGWGHLLYVAACGYTASGQPADPGPMRRLSLEG